MNPEPSLFDLTDRVALVIGAGSGIGAAVAGGFAASGAIVECLDVDLSSAQATATRIRGTGADVRSARVDITSSSDVDSVVDDIRHRRGRLDVVVCTPSINVRKPILKYSDDEFDRVWTVNVKGSFNVVRAAGRIMTADGRGSIVIFSSIRSQVVEPGQAVYAATKAAIVQLVRTAAAEFGPSGVRVNAVAPGVVETPLTAPIKANPDWYGAYARKSVFNRWARPDEMVGPTLFLASDASSYVTGTVLFADGGWTAADGRFLPPGM
jgi:NAD(P)-dependent dehydrogenase (short-subunit alcohol dehydrogenase family)